jgi:hypothetical protein
LSIIGKVRFVCLENSNRANGKCISGIVLDEESKPVIEDGKPKWVRLTTTFNHGEVSHFVAETFDKLDIIELDVTELCPDGHETENILFDEYSIEKLGKYDKNKLEELCESPEFIFRKEGRAIPEVKIWKINQSVMLLKIVGFVVKKRVSEIHPNVPEYRLVFEFNNIDYNLTITDPEFILDYQHRKTLLTGIKEIYIVVSIDLPLKDWYYKVVSSIIY